MGAAPIGFSYSASSVGTEPAGTLPGDLLIALASGTGSNGVIPTLATGWTSLKTQSTTGGFTGRFALIQRGATAPSLTFANAGAVMIGTIRGHNPANPVNALAAGNNTNGGTSNNPAPWNPIGAVLCVAMTICFPHTVVISGRTPGWSFTVANAWSEFDTEVSSTPIITWTFSTANNVCFGVAINDALPISGGSLPLLGVG